MVIAADFTYSKGYLGLLSTLGASLGIIFCCAPGVPLICQQWREASRKRAFSLRVHIDEEHAATASGIPNETLPPMTEDNAHQTNDTSTRSSIDIPSERFCAWLKSWSRAAHINEENLAASIETPDTISLPMIEDNATQTNGRSARRSIDGCVAGTKPPPYGGLQRYRTF